MMENCQQRDEDTVILDLRFFTAEQKRKNFKEKMNDGDKR